jgi:hypothetical protein
VEEAAQVAAHFGGHLAADEIERLDAVGAFIEHGDAGIAHVLSTPLSRISRGRHSTAPQGWRFRGQGR